MKQHEPQLRLSWTLARANKKREIAMDFGEYSYFPYMPNSNRAIVNQLYAISSYFATNINVHNTKRSDKMTQEEIDKDTEEAMKRYYKKKIREILRNEERLSTLRVVHYILTKKQS